MSAFTQRVMKEPPRRRNIREIETLQALVAREPDLRNIAVHNLDLTDWKVDWSSIKVDGSIFLGCILPPGVGDELGARGALVFPPFSKRPYDPYRRTLYSAEELDAEVEWFGTRKSLDELVYDWYSTGGAYLPDVGEALAQRTHDFSIDEALADVIGDTVQKRLDKHIVGIMGGHDVSRDAPAYESAARAALDLGRDHLVVTGGGPGIMEAGNLGAYLAPFGADALDDALETLRRAPTVAHPDYQARAREVLANYPHGTYTLSIPTWFYGFEKTSLFASGIAKYFANSIREDGLLAICLAGIIFADGSAGTVQEIFQDAAQNYYTTFDYQSPMVFLGTERWRVLESAMRTEAAPYQDLVLLTDSADETAEFIRSHPARKSPSV
jgi:predicted Rossmann-fold nucleotide-binding protein